MNIRASAYKSAVSDRLKEYYVYKCLSTEHSFVAIADRFDMHATIERLVCRHRYERRAVVVSPDEVVERCAKCGKERVRGVAGS